MKLAQNWIYGQKLDVLNSVRQQHSTKIPTNIGESLISQKIDFFLEEPSSTLDFYPLFCENFLCWSSNAQLENLENFWYFTLLCELSSLRTKYKKCEALHSFAAMLSSSSGNFKKVEFFSWKSIFQKCFPNCGVFVP